ncbi:MAG TPA: sigma-70 family RNA polymerase sigma factor [Flavipsychrobacter sp.]|nr:sigma-70 family RNA polymerase sigma factor [Flavipsychrobacter sp.]
MHHPLYTEQQLLNDLAKGDRNATEQIYKQHYKIISSWINQNGGTTTDASDIFQETMVILYEKSKSEDFRLTCKVGTYLFAISKHLWYKKLEKAQKQPRLLGDDIGGDGQDWAYEDDINSYKEKEMHYQSLDQALDQLGEPCRSLLKAFYHEDKNMQQIAAEFGYTNPDNAKTQKYKCLNRLRKIFYLAQAKLQ